VAFGPRGGLAAGPSTCAGVAERPRGPSGLVPRLADPAGIVMPAPQPPQQATRSSPPGRISHHPRAVGQVSNLPQQARQVINLPHRPPAQLGGVSLTDIVSGVSLAVGAIAFGLVRALWLHAGATHLWAVLGAILAFVAVIWLARWATSALGQSGQSQPSVGQVTDLPHYRQPAPTPSCDGVSPHTHRGAAGTRGWGSMGDCRQHRAFRSATTAHSRGECARATAQATRGCAATRAAVLWEQYASVSPGSDSGARLNLRRQLIEAYAPLARHVVERINVKLGPALGYEDLLSEAVIGLIDAVDRFDPARGIKFETYAYHRIRGAVMDMLRDLDWLPRSVRQRESELASAYADLQDRLGRAPWDHELADALGMSTAELDEIAQELAFQTVRSLDEVVIGHDSEGTTLGDSLPDRDALSPEAHLERSTEQELVARAVDALPESERTVISLYYHEGLTLKEIGRVLGVTESRACQIHGKAILRLRSHIESALVKVP